MVNLRYHVVSLVAVFLALAVGVVLGAGPLQAQISGNSRDDAQQIEELEAQTASLESTAEESTAFVDALSGEIVPGLLTGKAIAFVLLPGASADDVNALENLVTKGGGEVVGAVELTPDWASNGKREYRDSLSGPLSTHIEASTADMTADQILATALMETLTKSSKELDIAKQILADAENPLVSPDTYPSKPAGSIVLVGPAANSDNGADQAQSDSSGEDDLSAPSAQALVALAGSVQSASGSNVAIGSALDAKDFIAVLRDAGTPLTTVDQVGSTMGALNVVLALAGAPGGAYGQGIGATAPVAPLPSK